MESLDDLFLNARQIADSAERAAYLAKACSGNAELRQRVEAMLRDSEAADDFFGKQDTVVVAPAAALTEAPGAVIGRYKLLQKIGEGGMGVVYMAEQRDPVVRKVALKIIKLGMDTRQVIARFEAERQALALMDHPNIAKVLDGGTTEAGRPYFVMELVQGLQITQFCDEANLPMRERLHLFLDICSAVQHAHQKGIIHRDLKPSNILVTLHGDKPVPKVIDFGVAKATQGRLTDKTVFTQFQQFIGTPAYMSPEQTSLSGLDLDTRSDIYSLGVLLYELLTGKTPFDARELVNAGLEQMRKIIREQDPPRPSTRLSTMRGEDLTATARNRQTVPPRLIHLVRGDLDWIVMKCLEKDRARRYETANGLAMDLKRHLNNEPVLARAPSMAYRLQKGLHRHKILFTAGATVALILILATVISAWQAIRAARAERLARQQETMAQAVKNFLLEQVLAPVNPHTDPVYDPNKRAMLERVLLAVDGRANRLSAQASAEAFNASIYAIPNALSNQPLVEAEIRSAIGQGFGGLRDYTQAAVQHQKALAVRQLFLGSDHPDSLHNAARLSYAWMKINRTADAELLLDKTIAAGRASRRGLSTGLGAALWVKGDLLLRCKNQPAESMPYFHESLRVLRQAAGEQFSDVGHALNEIARATELLGKTHEAERLWQDALEHNERTYGHRIAVTAYSLVGQGQFFLELGRTNEALGRLQEAVSIQQAVFGPDGLDTLNAEFALGRAYERAGEIPKAAGTFLTQPARMRNFFAIESTITNCLHIARFFRLQGDSAQALAAYELIRSYLEEHQSELSQRFELLIAATAVTKGPAAARNLARTKWETSAAEALAGRFAISEFQELRDVSSALQQTPQSQ